MDPSRCCYALCRKGSSAQVYNRALVQPQGMRHGLLELNLAPRVKSVEEHRPINDEAIATEHNHGILYEASAGAI
jgi:hypothetical protein